MYRVVFNLFSILWKALWTAHQIKYYLHLCGWTVVADINKKTLSFYHSWNYSALCWRQKTPTWWTTSVTHNRLTTEQSTAVSQIKWSMWSSEMKRSMRQRANRLRRTTNLVTFNSYSLLQLLPSSGSGTKLAAVQCDQYLAKIKRWVYRNHRHLVTMATYIKLGQRSYHQPIAIPVLWQRIPVKQPRSASSKL